MPRLRLRAGRTPQEIGDAIIGTWYKVLPSTPGPIGNIKDTEPELRATLDNIVDTAVSPYKLVYDEPLVTHIVVPYVFEQNWTRQDLANYLHGHFKYSYWDLNDAENRKNPFNPRNRNKLNRQRTFGEDMGEALFFGCGR